MIHNSAMNITGRLKNIWSSSKAIVIGISLLLILFFTLIIFFYNTDTTVKNKEPAGDLPSTDMPDLAEAISRFSRDPAGNDPDREAFVEDFWRWIFGEAGIPERLARKVAGSALEGPDFVMELLEVLQQDPYTYYLVDKQHSIPDGYDPEDLVLLKGGSYRLSRDRLMLRRNAASALQELAAAAAAQGITLTVGSAYRSVEYQAQVYHREVENYGREAADRESAKPGKSQHQLGLALDFTPIDDAFAGTPAYHWLSKNAGRFGWSLSFPDGYEGATGYRWESWHYRYVGKDLAAFIDKYFEGIQQYALQFIHAWMNQAG
jgi:D-alanyl-D-alanine carboxypeptidase